MNRYIGVVVHYFGSRFNRVTCTWVFKNVCTILELSAKDSTSEVAWRILVGHWLQNSFASITGLLEKQINVGASIRTI